MSSCSAVAWLATLSLHKLFHSDAADTIRQGIDTICAGHSCRAENTAATSEGSTVTGDIPKLCTSQVQRNAAAEPARVTSATRSTL